MSSKQLCIFRFMSNVVFFLFNFMLLLIIVAISVSYGENGNETDHLALLSFKSMITHDPYGVVSSWNDSFHSCDWEGITCGKRHRRVTLIDLRSRGLVGSLSPYVGNLSFLRWFWLFNNSFQGNIPHELGHLFRLQLLDFSFNNFDGMIPANLSGSSNLLGLSLFKNNLVGNIPVEVSSLSKLTRLYLHSNYLTGGIPPSLGNLTSLEQFYAVENPLGGSIPDTFGRLKSLRVLALGSCNLSGVIPPSVYNLSLLNLSLPENQLTGSLPYTMGSILPQIEFLQLRNNQLTGSLPLSISNCSNLKFLELQENEFSGMIKVNFAGLKNISTVRLYHNNFGSGEPDEMKFLDSMVNCSELQSLDLSFNQFEGLLPNSIGNLSSQLFFLNLAVNQLYGSLPSSIGNLVGLTYLILGYNKFTGKIPPTIGKLQNLQYTTLSVNQLSGSIPDSVGNISLLIELYLYSNMLEREIPSSLGNCQNMLLLDLSQNKLTGSIPSQLLQLSSLSISLNLSQNNLFGSLPPDVAILKNLKGLDLSNNGLSGSIPSGISGCTSLETLYLQNNLFGGIIPPMLSSLRGITILDVSHNNLSGNIPQFLQQFSLEYLNLSYNNFEGEVPAEGVFTNASAVSVFGNSRLCGGLPELRLPKCRSVLKAKKQKRRIDFLPIFVSVACVFLIVCILSLCVFSWQKKKRMARQSGSQEKDGFLRVSYEQLFKATNGFSEDNMIGAGGFSSVYKGTLDDDGRTVAVKVLHLQNQEAHKSFIAECAVWRDIRHRNLVKIITSCSSVDSQGNDFKALVYEFMPNGNLEDLLHSVPRTQSLNLLQRVNTLIDVTCALDYLHNNCQPPVVHRDLKPSNILLDDEMVAHVGDFGLAKFLQADASHASSLGFGGTIGYAAPEYGLGSETTTSGDVYSFGILLLEMMTGKRPTDNMFNEGLNLHKLAFMALPDRVTHIIDETVLLNFDEEEEIGAVVITNSLQNAKKIVECVVSLFRIGVACSLESPQDRMNIEDVIHELQHIRDALMSLLRLAHVQRNINH